MGAFTSRAFALIVLALLPVSCSSAPAAVSARAAPAASAADPYAVVAEVHRLAAGDLWPGFDPREVPVAIFDGERTLLFRHPAPPEGFARVEGREGVWSFAGRHPSVVANSSAPIGGVETATLMPAATAVPLRAHAALLIHEAFHVFQRERHPSWSANEVELFTYPVTDSGALALRRLESEALRRALAATSPERSACWARAALDLRRERFAALPAGAATYERQTELNEGLATYVERRAAGAADTLVLPEEEFAPEAVRQRAYHTGVALALLLDRFSPHWRAELAQSDTLALEVLLSEALAGRGEASTCTFTAAERERIRRVALGDVEELRTRRAEQRLRFLEQPGWRLIVTSTGAPLFPQGFDPLNVQTVAPGEVLHTRFLKVGNQAGAVEVLGRAALTVAAGEHPLFNGVRTLTLSGLAAEPVVTETNGLVTVEAEGVTAELRGASVERSGQTVTLRLSS